MSLHLAQYMLTVVCRGKSLCPTGSTGCPWQYTRWQRPKSALMYFSYCTACEAHTHTHTYTHIYKHNTS